ncbi:2-succinyl-6-hydroxy-2,4-cyclohexadiene-1-carboxylate synthase [Sporosarcina sp. ACRSL]|uniref:2-succinyl-6-hydroxy-2, 4-cyclohexadiene-1-carboxylate synthase n=1 Tax=Sporosarcina sp. ACRSL TaxID=2918215 RepID=UPI001EF44347|nr:2-succinyl-6-hydroxy-2,4-cyclohexadiene-1-carboxylate synthase [Sporosarcina sp. ACRSL]MCG7342517.1 2-succinyl-6-hydroxy-2,4-cyclohexadiene-1-carboxylate synthase [Sporosarcina sp. ACRSL]
MNELQIPVRGLSIHVEMEGEPHLPAVVFLHGFTGTSATWKEVRNELKGKYRTITVDLTGHGNTTVPESPERYSMEEQIEDLEALFVQLGLDTFYVVGYSMGGRIALAYTIHYPKRVKALFLESSSPGLKEERDRIERRKADKLLAQKIMENGIVSFVDKWENIPLFESQKSLPAEKKQAVRNERLQQSETGLANSLLGIGTGSQKSYWESLHSIPNPVLLMTGELDAKFVGIAREMQALSPMWRHIVVPEAGHAIHVEKPRIFATMIMEYMQHIQQLEEEENGSSMGNNPYI